MKRKEVIIILILIFLITSCKTKTYTVSFVDESNNYLSSIEVNKGDNVANIDPPTKDGYIFVTWLKDGVEYDSSAPVTKDIVLSASWIKEPKSPNNHTVTFNFGNELKTQTIPDGEKVLMPRETPKKEKHTFLGWYVGDDLYDFDLPVTKDIIIVAKFAINRVVVTYDLNGGSGTTIKTEIEKGTIPTKPKDPTKFGYTFFGWYLDGKPYEFNFPLNEDTTIKAYWIAVVYYKVTYDTDGGSIIASAMVPENSSLTELPVPTKAGYTFKYWSLSDTAFDINTKITSDITLLAIYEKIPEEDLE